MAENMILGRKKTDALFQDQVSHQYMRWHDRLVQAVRTAMPADSPYYLLHAENLVGVSCPLLSPTPAIFPPEISNIELLPQASKSYLREVLREIQHIGRSQDFCEDWNGWSLRQ